MKQKQISYLPGFVRDLKRAGAGSALRVANYLTELYKTLQD
jgi:hypothetical protein